MNLNSFIKSRTRGIPTVLGIIIVACIGIGKLTGRPFDMRWLWALVPYAGFILSEFNKKKHITLRNVFAAKKFTETRWITGLITALLPVVSWIIYLVSGLKIEIPGETIATAAGIIALLISAYQGGDLSTLIQAAGDMKFRGKGKKGKN